MAITNAQIAQQLEELREAFEQKLSFSSSPENADAALGNKIFLLDESVKSHLAKSAGDSTETIRRLDQIEHNIRNVEILLAGYVSRPREKTMHEKLSDMLAKIMGTPAR